jgi:hypothetical protein
MDEVEALKVLHRLVSVVASAHLSVKADSKRLVVTWHQAKLINYPVEYLLQNPQFLTLVEYHFFFYLSLC